MADLIPEEDELKKLIKKGKTRPMHFAFCPSSDDEPDLLVIHRKKAPQKLGKAARKEVGGTKVAYGTFTMEGKEMTLTCERTLPAVGKKIKKFLRTQKLTVSIVVLDAEGNDIGV